MESDAARLFEAAEAPIAPLGQVPGAVDPHLGELLTRIIERIEGMDARISDAALSKMIDLGVVVPSPDGGGGYIPPPAPPGEGGGTYIPDLTPPPIPSGLTVLVGFATLQLRWNGGNLPGYSAGHGHSTTRVYVGEPDINNNPPTFAQATLIGTSDTGFYVDPARELGKPRHYWISYVTKDGVEGNPAGGINGVVGTSGLIGGADLSNLIIDAAKLAEYAVTPSKLADGSIDLGGAKVTGTITDPVRFGAAAVGYVVTQYLVATSGVLGNLIVDDAQIANLSAAKVTFGTMSGARIALDTLDGNRIISATADINRIAAGLILAGKIDTRGLDIKAADGTVLFSSGATPTLWNSNLISPAAGWLNSNISLSDGKLTGIGLGNDTEVANSLLVPSINAAALTASWGGISSKPTFGDLAWISQLTTANISTYIAAAAIDLALIKTASIGSLAALSARMGTLISGDIQLGSAASSGWSLVRSRDRWWTEVAKPGIWAATHDDGSAGFEFLTDANNYMRLWNGPQFGGSGFQIYTPNFRVAPNGDVYARGDIEADSVKANKITTDNLVADAATRFFAWSGSIDDPRPGNSYYWTQLSIYSYGVAPICVTWTLNFSATDAGDGTPWYPQVELQIDGVTRVGSAAGGSFTRAAKETYIWIGTLSAGWHSLWLLSWTQYVPSTLTCLEAKR